MPEAVCGTRGGKRIDRHGDDGEWICLGELPHVSKAKRKHPRKLVANVIHYGTVRSNLRDADRQRRAAA